MDFDLEQLDPAASVVLYAAANIIITSICPIPLGVFMIVAAALMWGALLGGGWVARAWRLGGRLRAGAPC